MTNYEKYRSEIEKIARLGRSVAVDKGNTPRECCEIDCKDCIAFGKTNCYDVIDEWADAEYIEPEMDWSKVPVNARIVISNDNTRWYNRHFAKYESGEVYAWEDGRTSHTTDKAISWEYARLVEVDNGI